MGIINSVISVQELPLGYQIDFVRLVQVQEYSSYGNSLLQKFILSIIINKKKAKRGLPQVALTVGFNFITMLRESVHLLPLNKGQCILLYIYTNPSKERLDN